VLFRMKRDRYAWVTVVPTAWLLVCTVSAGLLKLVSPDPAVSFVTHALTFSDAAARGEILAPAVSMEEMERIIFNDWVDAGLCVLFLAVVLSLLVFTVRTVIEARRAARPTAQEVVPPAVPAQ